MLNIIIMIPIFSFIANYIDFFFFLNILKILKIEHYYVLGTHFLFYFKYHIYIQN